MDAAFRHRLIARGLGAGALAALFLAFAGANVAADRWLRGARLDLTENGLYTLAAGTRRLVGRLPEPIDLYFFFSRGPARDAPSLGVHAARVRDLLEEITAASGGRIRLHVLDPAPYSDDEDRAAEWGLKPLPLSAGGDPVWFGLVGTNPHGGRAVIEFFAPDKEPFLEYDVARLVHALVEPRRRTVGLVSSLPLGGGTGPAGRPGPSWAIADRLAEQYDLRPVPLDAERLPDGLDALVVVQPKGLSDALKHAVDRYVAGGGRLLLFVDPDSQQDESAYGPDARVAGGDRASTFEPMLKAWGVGYDATRAVGDLGHALVVGDDDGAPVRHLAFAAFGRDAFTSDEPLTAALDAINVATPGYLEPEPRAGVRFEPLLTTGPQSAPIPTDRLALATGPESLRAGFTPTGRRYVIAARLTGRLPPAYPEDAVPAAGPATAIVVADTDLLSDMLWVRARTLLGQRYAEPWASNGDFVLNAVDQLTGNADLIGLRGRAPFARPFTRVEALRSRTDEQLRAKAGALQAELDAAERRLAELDAQGARGTTEGAAGAELARYEADRLRLRRELRATRRALDVEIERLGARLRLLDILAMPLVLSITALAVAALRRHRRRAARGALANPTS